MGKKKILIVDDEQDLCEILQFNLESAGYETDVAYSAEETISKGIGHYDLLLLDVMMPGLSGFELAQRLKGDEQTVHIPAQEVRRLRGLYSYPTRFWLFL